MPRVKVTWPEDEDNPAETKTVSFTHLPSSGDYVGGLEARVVWNVVDGQATPHIELQPWRQ